MRFSDRLPLLDIDYEHPGRKYIVQRRAAVAKGDLNTLKDEPGPPTLPKQATAVMPEIWMVSPIRAARAYPSASPTKTLKGCSGGQLAATFLSSKLSRPSGRCFVVLVRALVAIGAVVSCRYPLHQSQFYHCSDRRARPHCSHLYGPSDRCQITGF